MALVSLNTVSMRGLLDQLSRGNYLASAGIQMQMLQYPPQTTAQGAPFALSGKKLHMLNLPRLIAYSYLPSHVIVHTISRLGKQERKLLSNAALVF